MITINYYLNPNNPPTDIALSSTSVNENVSIGTTIGSLTSTDSDSVDSHTYSLVSGIGDSDNSSFSIGGSDLLTATSLDYETKNNYSIVIQTSNGTGTYSKTFTLSITDIFDEEDGYGVRDIIDNAPNTPSSDQRDTDGYRQRDVIDTDDDNDGMPDSQDAFPTNTQESLDCDGDGIGDALDPDADNDGINDENDNCITVVNPDQADLYGDGYTFYSELS